MKSYYVQEHDIYYIELRDGQRATAEEREPGIVVDLDADGRPLSLEIQGASTTTPQQLFAVLQEFGIELRVPEKVA
jgi:uncharacterized protein YuzE